jgi:hypothetical protein
MVGPSEVERCPNGMHQPQKCDHNNRTTDVNKNDIGFQKFKKVEGALKI